MSAPAELNALNTLQGHVAAMPPPGICLFSRDAAILGSKAGITATLQMQKFVAQIQVELGQQRQAIIQGSDAGRQVQQRAEQYAQLEQVRNAQLLRTRAIGEQKIGLAIPSILQNVIAARHCAIVIDRNTAYGWNNSADITSDVIGELDKALPSIDLNLSPP